MSESVKQVGTFPVLEVGDLHKTYPSDTHAVKGIPFTINKGGRLGAVGESGSGKLTLAKCLLTLEPVSAGRATLEGEPLLQRHGKGSCDIRRHLQMMFQSPASLFNSWLTMYGSLLEPLCTRGFVSPSFVQSGTQRKVAEQLVDLVYLSVSCLDRKLRELSGSEKQRVVTAQAISMRPILLILNEPAVSLDVPIQVRVSNLLQKLKEELGLPSMFIPYDLSAVQFMSECPIALRGGRIVDRSGRDELFEDGRDQYIKDLIKLLEG